MPPTSPRPCTTWSKAGLSLTSVPRVIRRILAQPSCKNKQETGMGPNILIVEAEEPLTTLLRYNLEAEGYEVDAVSRGDDADTRLRETAPDLIVLDWMLPGLSGIELCRRLRTRPPTPA